MKLRVVLHSQMLIARRAGLLDLLESGAKGAHLPLPFVLAVASRETGIRNIAGDGGHGRGVMQVDDRWHAIAAKTDFEAHPEVLIDYGCGLLRSNFDWAKKHWPEFSMLQHFKIAAASYNCGRGGVSLAMASGDCDARTTGGNYGRDVLVRMAIYQELLLP